MLTQEALKVITDMLWATRDEQVYCILDGASIQDLLDRLYAQVRPEFECLYRGELAPDIAEVAPYLVKLEHDAEFTRWVLSAGWGNHWGIFMTTPADLRSLRQHFRKLNVVYDPEHRPLLFRYYDPRVLRVFAPTTDEEQLAEVFGPVHYFILEGSEPGQVLRLTLTNGQLQQEIKSLPLGIRTAQGV
jgi:hypothetical protein